MNFKGYIFATDFLKAKIIFYRYYLLMKFPILAFYKLIVLAMILLFSEKQTTDKKSIM